MGETAARVTMSIWDKLVESVLTSWGLEARLFVRYIDDIRYYGPPIARYWRWTHSGWVFDCNIEDHRDPTQRTCEELNKVFDSIFSFLRFTTENETDFTTGYLPTIDVETKVLNNGIIDYRFFIKPMKNNMVIQKGTALSRNTVFSSLRQEILRRMLNTCEFTEWNCRLRIIEDMVQLMKNSGHEFSFIKSVVLQGITKYEFMKWRSNLAKDHEKYMPLHRDRSFRNDERVLVKYLSIMTWFTDEKLQDPFRQEWKKLIRYKDSGQPKPKKTKARRSADQHTTTTFFVPASKNSLLFKLIKEKEDKIRNLFEWKVMILEAPGTPLLNRLTSNFPIEEGCPRGLDCVICGSEKSKCGRKGVIYKAKCLKCSNLKTVSSSPTYIGETSRPWRDRVIEHMNGIKKINPDSVFIEHWMLMHGTETVCPDFKFEIVTAYPDPLRRQIGEALNILTSGTLNRKTEFNMNEIGGFDAKEHPADVIKRVKHELDQRKKIKDDLKTFTDLMLRIEKVNGTNGDPGIINSNITNFYRLKRTAPTSPGNCGQPKRKKIMETSTPTTDRQSYRKTMEQEDLISPIKMGGSQADKDSPRMTPEFDRDTSDKEPAVLNHLGHTAISDKITKLVITMQESESSSSDKRIIYILA